MGVDLGGTKIEVAVFDEEGSERLRRRVPTPHTGYDQALAELARVIEEAEREAGARCSVGIGIDGKVVRGLNGIAGEWGHTPLPWMTVEEHPGPPCYCGRAGCIEQFVAGPALNKEIAARGEELANELHEDRLARAFSMVINFLDPDVIVLGGGLSNVERLYTTVPRLLPRYVYAQTVETSIVPAQYGDASGVRGAAMLWAL